MVRLLNSNLNVLIFCPVCQNLYNRLCSLWDDYCQPEAYRFVKENVIERYRYSCPVTCGKCRPGQKMLDSSIYSKWITSQTDLSLALSIRSTKIYRAFEIGVNGSKISLESFQKIQKQLSYKIHFENTLLKFYIIFDCVYSVQYWRNSVALFRVILATWKITFRLKKTGK